MGSFQRITLKDIASQAGVSHVAVSLALRNHKSIPEITRNRIQAIAKRLGYRPDPILSALNTYRLASQAARYQANFAMIEFGRKGFASLTTKPETEYYYYWTGARERAAEIGYTLEVFRLDDLDQEARQLSRLLYRRQIQGVLLAPLPPAASKLNLDWELFSTVVFGFTHQPVFHSVCSSQYRNARLGARKLHEYGYSNVGMLTWKDIDWRTDRNFSSGYWAEQKAARKKPIILDLEEEACFRNGPEIKRWILKNKLDAILTPCSALVLPVLEKLGIRVPEDIGVATLAYVPTESHNAGIDQRPKLSGRAAVDVLAGLIQRNERGRPETPLRTLIEGSWVDGRSVSAASRQIKSKVKFRPTSGRVN